MEPTQILDWRIWLCSFQCL